MNQKKVTIPQLKQWAFRDRTMQTHTIRFPQVRACYSAPATDIDSREVVGVPNEAARPTHKLCLRYAVGFLAVPTGGAGAGSIARVNEGQGYSGAFGLVPELLAQVEKRPAMQGGTLRLSQPYPSTDARKVFQGNAASGAFSLFHNAFAERVVGMVGKTGLLAAELFQAALSPLGGLLLELLAKAAVAVADAVQVRTRVAFAVGVRRYLDDAQVNPEHSRGGQDGRVVELAPQVDVPRIAAPHQLAALDAFGGAKQMALIPGDVHRDFGPPVHGAEADHLVPDVHRKDALVVVNRRSLEAASPVALALSHAGNGPDSKVGAEAVGFPKLAVHQFLKGELVPGVLPTRHLQSVVAGIRKLVHRAGQLFGCARIGYQFASHGQEGHTLTQYITFLAVQRFPSATPFLPRLKHVGFRGSFRVICGLGKSVTVLSLC